MLLQGNLKEFSLPHIFQLVKMSAKSGALTIRRGDERGKIFFRHGLIYYGFSVPQHLPSGERLVKSGAISAEQLKTALAAQKKEGEGARIGAILLGSGVIDRGTLDQSVREPIQDTAFKFFSWLDGEFEFSADEQVTDEDINVILRDCGLDRFHGAKVIYSLYSSGLIVVGEPAIEGIGRGLSVAVRGPIDIYNEVFLNTLTDSNVVKQLRVELIDEKEDEIPVSPASGRRTTGTVRSRRRPQRSSSSRPPRSRPSRPGGASPARARPGCCWPTPTTRTTCAPPAPTWRSCGRWATCRRWWPPT